MPSASSQKAEVASSDYFIFLISPKAKDIQQTIREARTYLKVLGIDPILVLSFC